MMERSIERLFEAHARAAELRRDHGADSTQYAEALAHVATLRTEHEAWRREAWRREVASRLVRV